MIPALARRFLLSRSSSGFLSFIAWVSVLGVALGVLALTVVTSVINGFDGELTKAITGMNGDVILYSRGNPIPDPEAIEEKIRKVVPAAEAITRSFMTEMMVAGPAGVGGALLEGIDADTIGRVTSVPERVTAGRLPVMSVGEGKPEVVLGNALAERIGAGVGDEVRLIFPFAGKGLSEGRGDEAVPEVVQAVVSGIVQMGFYKYDSKLVVGTLPDVQRILGQKGMVTTFRLLLRRRADPSAAAIALSENFGYPFRAKSWDQLDRNLLYAIRLEKAVIAIIMTAIIVVAAFNVVSTLMMMIHDKSKEIAILKAMGFAPSAAFRLFCLIGAGIGITGTGLGLAVGLAVVRLLAKTHWIDLPADIYYIGFLPVVVHGTEIVVIAFFAVAICLLATLYPALKVARQSPLEGLRYE